MVRRTRYSALHVGHDSSLAEGAVLGEDPARAAAPVEQPTIPTQPACFSARRASAHLQSRTPDSVAIRNFAPKVG